MKEYPSRDVYIEIHVMLVHGISEILSAVQEPHMNILRRETL